MKKVKKVKLSKQKHIDLFCVAYGDGEEKMSSFEQDTCYKDSSEDTVSASNKIPFVLPAPLTFTTTIEEANHYCELFLRLKYKEHYTMWCSAHPGEDSNSYESGVKYRDSYVEEAESDSPLQIYHMICTPDQVARVLRIVCCTTPVAAPWESKEEIDYLVSNFYDIMKNGDSSSVQPYQRIVIKNFVDIPENI